MCIEADTISTQLLMQHTAKKYWLLASDVFQRIERDPCIAFQAKLAIEHLPASLLRSTVLHIGVYLPSEQAFCAEALLYLEGCIA